MAEINFVFGFGNSHFFSCPKAWDWKNIPFADKFKKYAEYPIYGFKLVALGPTGGFLVYFKGYRGTTRAIWEGSTASRVHDWFKEEREDWIIAPKLTFGPNGTYFAIHERNYNYRIDSDSLEDIVERAFDKGNPITEVALGRNRSFVVLRRDGSFIWRVEYDYSELGKIMENAVRGDITHVSLSPNSGHYFVAFNDKSCRFLVPATWEADVRKIAETIGHPFSIGTTGPVSQPSYRGYSGYSSHRSTSNYSSMPSTSNYAPTSLVARNQTSTLERVLAGLGGMGILVTAGVGFAGAVGCSVF